jgi:lipid II:glycine glycyltransferase (peptidoglycan interpeptide bridge formation enzyme)
MIEWIWTREQAWRDKWDAFNNSTTRGHYLQLTDWLKSYSEFGFGLEMLIGHENGDIKIGMGVVKAKFSFFKFYVVNCGPIVREGYEEHIEESYKLFLDKSKKEGACYCHINSPIVLEEFKQWGFTKSALQSDSIFYTGRLKTPFQFVISVNGFRMVDLAGKDKESYLNALDRNKRRDIKIAEKKGVELKIAETEDDIRTSYSMFENNSKEQHYNIRPWESFRSTILNLHKKGFSEFVMAYKDGVCKGALWLILAGRRYTYTMGGTLRERPDLHVGHYLHWYVVEQSIEKGLQGYDFSPGGSQGVIEFKNSYNPDRIEFEPGRHWVFSPIRYNVFMKVLPMLKKNKVVISKLIRLVKGKK